ncbi:MAG: long-chain fatty acid--CoA ligase [Treponema sp.]|jgi:long-chain acyl-CoA synthetase|nr:long-chain fatty acid--CoA ligase [Treponema sp.]
MLKLSEMTLAGLCTRSSEKYGKRIAFETYRENKIYRPVSYRLLGIRSRQCAALLVSLGIKAGDRVMILAENSPLWVLAYFGAAIAGAVSVPVPTDLSAEQIRGAARHAGVSAIFVSGRFNAKTAGLDPAIPKILLDTFEGDKIQAAVHGITKVLPLRDPGGVCDFPRRAADDPVSIIYSGETLENGGGLMLSNRNLIRRAAASRSLIKIFPRDRLLSVIPLAYAHECALGLLAPVMSGSLVACLDRAPSPQILLSAAQALRPTIMISDSFFIEKLCGEKIIPPLRKNPLYRLVLTRPFAENRAGRKLLKQLGSSVRFFAVADQALSAETEAFLRRVKFPLACCHAAAGGAADTRPLYSATTDPETALPTGA